VPSVRDWSLWTLKCSRRAVEADLQNKQSVLLFLCCMSSERNVEV
jgi:hypothetical protein